MGIYRYTLRAATKRLGGHEIGQFKFAYKPFWGDQRDKTVCALHAAASRAAAKLEGMGCKLFVQGSWGDGQRIYYRDRAFETFLESLDFLPCVGWLCKDSRGRWYLNLKSEEQLLAEYHEIGVLQTEDGVRYYHMLRGGERRFDDLRDAVADVHKLRTIQS